MITCITDAGRFIIDPTDLPRVCVYTHKYTHTSLPIEQAHDHVSNFILNCLTAIQILFIDKTVDNGEQMKTYPATQWRRRNVDNKLIYDKKIYIFFEYN